jgi:hypothetical protein
MWKGDEQSVCSMIVTKKPKDPKAAPHSFARSLQIGYFVNPLQSTDILN